MADFEATLKEALTERAMMREAGLVSLSSPAGHTAQMMFLPRDPSRLLPREPEEAQARCRGGMADVIAVGPPAAPLTRQLPAKGAELTMVICPLWAFDRRAPI